MATYWCIVYGCADVREGNDHVTLEAWKKFEVLAASFKPFPIQTAESASSEYAGIALLDSRSAGTEGIKRVGVDIIIKSLPDVVVSVEELPSTIADKIDKRIAKSAGEAWREFQKLIKKELDITLPKGELLWICDFD